MKDAIIALLLVLLALAVALDRDHAGAVVAVQGATVSSVDYQRFVTVRPAPLNRPSKPVLYPNNSELS